MSKKREHNEGERKPGNTSNKGEGRQGESRKSTGRPGYFQPKDSKGFSRSKPNEEGDGRRGPREKPYGRRSDSNTSGKSESKPKFFQPKDTRSKQGREKSYGEKDSLRPERTGKLSYGRRNDDKTSSQRSGKSSYSKSNDSNPSFRGKDGNQAGERQYKKPYNSEREGKAPFSKSRDERTYRGGEENKSYRKEEKPEYKERNNKSSFSRSGGEKSSYRGADEKRSSFKKDERPNDRERKGMESDSKSREEKSFSRGEEKRSSFREGKGDKPFGKGREYSSENKDVTKRETSGRFESGKEKRSSFPEKKPRIIKNTGKENKEGEEEKSKATGDIRLNRFIANAGICSRRDADLLIQAGEITVNGEVVTEMGYKVNYGDDVRYNKRRLKREKMVYVLLNKPKDFITTTEDPENRKTIMQLVEGAGSERIYPVGRLDRNTTGLILITNDGELADKLSHPSNNIKKLYQVDLDKPITEEDLLKIREGVVLEDGKAEVDQVAIVSNDNKSLGLQIHSGKNRIVRRIFEHLGYDVVKLDRVMYAGLDKKDLPRGKWRLLTEQEVIKLKYMK